MHNMQKLTNIIEKSRKGRRSIILNFAQGKTKKTKENIWNVEMQCMVET